MSGSKNRERGIASLPTTPRGRAAWLIATAVLVVAIAALALRLVGGAGAAASAIEFTDVRAQTLQFIEWNDSITLTPEQEAIKEEALTAVPAPCCSDNSAATCCCPCNMAKSWWGLAKHLIAERGASVDEVRAAVEEWIEFINPGGFSGDACSTGGCGRPFHDNGCGGMSQSHVVF